jgi:Flp pilus assembly protein TadG
MESMHPLKWLRKLSRNQRGNALAIVAAAMPLVVGAAAIGVDTISASLARRQLQRAADSAALAGAYALVQHESHTTAAEHDLTLNNDVTLNGAPVIESAPTAGPWAGSARAVRVVLTAERVVPFIGFFTGDTMTVTTEATASWLYVGDYCAVALEEGATTGINITGNATVGLGCGMISNSSGASAVTATGSASITASPIAAVGNVPASANYASGTELLPYSLPFDDPFEDLPTPVLPACNGNSHNRLGVQPQETLDLSVGTESARAGYSSPGVYCFKGLDVKGVLTLPSNSTIYIDGSSFDVNSGASLTCSACTFILTSSTAATSPSTIADLNINGGATLNLTAPDTGTYAGVLFYQDERAPFGSSHINGNATTFFRGAFYFPNRELVFNGTAGMSTACVQLVGRRLGFSGNAAISNTCPEGSASQGFEHKTVRLVG